MKGSSEITGTYPIEGIISFQDTEVQIGIVNVLNHGLRISEGD